MATHQVASTILSGEEDIFQPLSLENPTEGLALPRVNPSHPFYHYHNKLFDPSHFLNGYMPILLGRHDFARDYPVGMRILRTPIKVAGDTRIHIPKEISFLTDFIKFCVMYELSFNENFADLYAVMTVHSKNIVVAERNTMRISGFHVDGLRDNVFPVDTKLRHSYLWTDNNATQFCSQPFFVHKGSSHTTTNEFDRQAHSCNIIAPMANTLVLFDQYMVHRSPPIAADCTRMFLRISFMYKQLKDHMDTINPNLPVELPPYRERVVERSVKVGIADPTFS